MNIATSWLVLGILFLTLVASPFILTSLRTGRRLKKGELKHHIDCIRDPDGSCDKAAADMHYDEARSIVEDRLRWHLSLSDAGYEHGLEELEQEKNNSIRRYKEKHAAFAGTIPQQAI